MQASHRSARGVDADPGARVADPPVGDPRPVLLVSDPSRGRSGRALGVRDVLASAPRRAGRLRRSPGSGLALIGVALAGSIGAVSAVNVALFPHLGETTAESVWQNPGRVPPPSLVSTSTTPRSDRTVVVDPTVPPQLVAVTPTIAPSTSAIAAQAVGTEPTVESASVVPGQRPASGGSTPTSVAGVTATGTTLPRSPTTPSGSGTGSSGTGSGSVVTAAGGTDDTGPDTSATATTATTTPSATSNTSGSNTSTSAPATTAATTGPATTGPATTAPDVTTATSIDDKGGNRRSGSGSGSSGSGSGSGGSGSGSGG